MAIEEKDHTPTPVLMNRLQRNIDEMHEIIEVVKDRNATGGYGDGPLLAISSRLDESDYALTELGRQLEYLEDDLRGLDYTI